MKGKLIYDKKKQAWFVEALIIDTLTPIKSYIMKVFPIHPDMCLIPVESPFDGKEVEFELVILFRNSNFDWSDIIPFKEMNNTVENKEFAKILKSNENNDSLNNTTKTETTILTWKDISKCYYKELKSIIKHENHSVFDWLDKNFEVPKTKI